VAPTVAAINDELSENIPGKKSVKPFGLMICNLRTGFIVWPVLLLAAVLFFFLNGRGMLIPFSFSFSARNFSHI